MRSHPAAFDQCRELLGDWNVRCVPAATTADAARESPRRRRPRARCDRERRGGRRLLADRVADDVGDGPGAFTRFVAVAPYTQVAGGEGWRTALSFVTDHQPGALFRALGAVRAQRASTSCSSSRARCPTRRGATGSTSCSTGTCSTPGCALRCSSCASARASCALFGSYAAERDAMTATLFDKIWDAHLVDRRPAARRAPLRRPASRARGDEPAGVRGAARRRAAGAPARPDGRDDGPQRADARRAGHRPARARAARRAARATARSSACGSSRPAAAARGSCT